tara:strand:+ start:13 stop:669 length:657 start_codon:yes stop_codon:yes gene_type:complete
MNELNQLLFDFNHKQNFNYDDFYVSKSNFFAFKLVEDWPKWEKNIVNIFGETLSGKSHLTSIFLKKNKAIKITKNNLNSHIITKLKTHQNIIIDNLDEHIDQEILYSIFNTVDQDNKYLIINSQTPINKMKFSLKDLSSRSSNCLFAKIDKPDDELIFALILKSFSDKQVIIEKKIIDFIVKRIDRSYRKIFDFIYKLDQLSLKKKKPINLKTIKEIL